MAYERREYAGGARSTTLSVGINSSDMSFTLDDSTNWPTGATGDFMVVIDPGLASEEKVRCDTRSGDVITVAASGRGSDGTSAAAHSASAVVEHVFTALDANEANAHYADPTLDHHTSYLTAGRHDAHDHSTALTTAVLADLADVASTAPSSTYVLAWNGTAWAPAPASGGGHVARTIIATRGANQSIPDGGAPTAVSWDAEESDLHGFRDGASPTRLTVPSGMGGVYAVAGSVFWASNGTGVRTISVRVDGAVKHYEEVAGIAGLLGGQSMRIPSRSLVLNAAQYVEVFVFQNSGGALNLVGNTAAGVIANLVSLTYLGPAS